MKNRLSTMGKSASWMLVLLAACGVTSSCKDEYRLDDEKPSYLNSSILQSLESQQSYTYYLRLLNDKDVNPLNEPNALAKTLSLTGSKTVFVADDAAWEAFFKKNATLPASDPWHTATSYENLSASQKKLLVHTSMLNNAIVMENLASRYDASQNSKMNQMVRGEYMRRFTDVETTDSITYLDGNALPRNYNEKNAEKDFWWRFRTENGGKGIYLVNDSSQSMMVHFTNEHLKKNNVTDKDFAIMMGEERLTEDVHIFDAKLTDKDGVCENGYINKTSKLIAPLPNMAEMLRTNGETNIFSHMLDRWSVPYYNQGVTKQYKDIMQARGIDFTDSIFTKRYISSLSWGHAALNYDPETGKAVQTAGSTQLALKFDPGWNAYYNEKNNPQYDMAAMYVPNDEAMWAYFTEGGGGWQLIKTYYIHADEVDELGNSLEIPYKKPTSLDELYRQIDQIPIGELKELINVIMFNSFISSVPSKMTTLRNDAQEQIFYADDINHIKKGILANNGIIYITDKVYGPADFTSVAAPAKISETNRVMRWAIYNGSDKSESDVMGLNYYAYLKAMQSKFAFFLPSDKAMAYYYDPVSFESQKPRVIHMSYKKANFPITYKLYMYNPATASIERDWKTQTISNDELANRLKDILESHTLVLNDLDEIDSDVNEYYLTKNGSAVKVTRAIGADGKPHVVKVQGGFQLENEEEGLTGTITSDNENAYTEIKGIQGNQVTDEHNMSNGTTYILDSPIIPAARSVYSNLTNRGNFDSPYYSSFYTYCCEPDEAIIKACGLVDETHTLSEQRAEMKKFLVFVGDNAPDQNVQFFNNYNYTIFVPTNEAMEDAVTKGLPTWESIKADFEKCEKNDDGELKHTADSLRLQAKITYITNFVRYHFADNSVFADKSDINQTDYVTSSYDNQTSLFCKLWVQRKNGVLEVKDNTGGDWKRISGRHNIMARDIDCTSSPRKKSSMNGIKISGSSFAVIHQIPGVLNFKKLTNGRYDADWATTSGAKALIKRYAIHK